MTKQEGALIVAMIAGAYPSWNPSKETVGLYVALLEDLDADETKNALKRLLMASEYPPSVAAIRKKVYEFKNGTPLSQSEAWSLVLQAVNARGTYNRPTFENEVIQAVVEGIGWYQICTSTNPDTIRAHFFKLYSEQLEKNLTEHLESVGLNSNQIEGVKVRGEIEA